MARADKFTVERKKSVMYSDFTPNMDKNPLTGLLAKLTNEESVKNSIKNLVKTMRRERFNQPLVGSKITGSLFENFGPDVADEMKQTIENCIENDEPRAQNVIVEIKFNPSSPNQVRVNITFSMKNIPDPISFDVILKRVR
jgi:phage baseplate assembly protein W